MITLKACDDLNCVEGAIKL